MFRGVSQIFSHVSVKHMLFFFISIFIRRKKKPRGNHTEAEENPAAEIENITQNSNSKDLHTFISTRNIQYFDIFSTKFKMHFSDILIITERLL